MSRSLESWAFSPVSFRKVGANCGELYRFVQENLPFEKYGIYLNPGHLIHLDEWLSSQFYAGSKIPLKSGMVIQVDVIPSRPTSPPCA